jgi:purine-cytosine permease-like protein
VGRGFYRLAGEHKKSKWLWAVLGVVFYYAFGFLLGVIMALVNLSWSLQNKGLLTLLGIGVGIGCTIIIYRILKYNWEKAPTPNVDVEILDQ